MTKCLLAVTLLAQTMHSGHAGDVALPSSSYFQPKKRIYPYVPEYNDVVDYYLRHFQPGLRGEFHIDRREGWKRVVPDGLSPTPSLFTDYETPFKIWETYGLKDWLGNSAKRKGRKPSGFPIVSAGKLERYPGQRGAMPQPWPILSIEGNQACLRRTRATDWAEPTCMTMLGDHMEHNVDFREKGQPLIAHGETDGQVEAYKRYFYVEVPRTQQGKYLRMMNSINAYGRLGDYQCRFVINGGIFQYFAGTGWTSHLGWQQTGNTAEYMTVNSLIAGVKKQYGLKWISESEAYCLHAKGFSEHWRKVYEKLKDWDKKTYKTEREKRAAFDAFRRARIRKNRSLLTGMSWGRAWQNFLILHIMGSDHHAGYGRRMRGNQDEITAFGRAMDAMNKQYLDRYPDPGGQYAPIAFMQDIFSWKDMPRWKWGQEVCVGVHTHYAYFSALYPLIWEKYINTKDSKAMVKHRPDEQVARWVGSPYGGYISDTLVTDAQSHLLDRYGLIVLSTEINAHYRTLADKFMHYMKNGGNFVVTAENARRLWPALGIKKLQTVPAGSALSNAVTGGNITEICPFDLYSVNLPEKGRIRISYGEKPVVVEIPYGKGCLTLSLTPYAIGPKGKTKRRPCLEHFKELLRSKSKSLGLFDPGPDSKDVMTVYSRDRNGVFTVGVANSHLAQRRFELKPMGGISVKETREMDIGDTAEMVETGYFADVDLTKPEEDQDKEMEERRLALGKNGDAEIMGLGVRIFRLKLEDESSLEVLPKYISPRRRPNWYVNFPVLTNLRERLQIMPYFWEHFSGIKVDADEFLNWDMRAINLDLAWLTARHVEFIIDARMLKTEQQLMKVVERMSAFEYAKDLLVGNVSVSDSLKELAAEKHIRIHGPEDRNATYVVFDNRTDKSTITTMRNNKNVMKIIDVEHNVIMHHAWDMIYDNYCRIRDYTDGRLELKGSSETLTASGSVLSGGSNYIHVHNSIADLPLWLSDHPELFKVKGLKGFAVDPFYVFSRSDADVKTEVNWLEKHGVELIVDLAERVNGGYGNVSYNPMPSYREGLVLYDSVLDKMQKAGLNEMFFAGPNLTWPQDEFEKKTAEHFVEVAEKKGVNIHLRPEFGWEWLFKSKTAMGNYALVIPPIGSHIKTKKSPWYINRFRNRKDHDPRKHLYDRQSPYTVLNLYTDEYTGKPLYSNEKELEEVMTEAGLYGNTQYILAPNYLSAKEMVDDLKIIKTRRLLRKTTDTRVHSARSFRN